MLKLFSALSLPIFILSLSACKKNQNPAPQRALKPVIIERNAPGLLIRSYLTYQDDGNPQTITDSSFTNDSLNETRVHRFFYNQDHKIDYVSIVAQTPSGERTFFERKDFQWEGETLKSIRYSSGDTEYLTYNAQGKITEIVRASKNNAPYWRETYAYNEQGNYTEERTYHITQGTEQLFSVLTYSDFDQKQNAYTLIPYYEYLVSIPAQRNNAQTQHYTMDLDQDGILEKDESITSNFKFLYDVQGLPTNWQQLDQNYTHTFAAKYQSR
ncbi:MAG TPA: hypothetical protein DCS93_03525 [Microscillaceae bacterium]|nr:hypothetical protein [Microscillaceae bacterium]